MNLYLGQYKWSLGLPRWSVVNNLPANAGEAGNGGSIPGREDPLEKGMATTPVFLPGKSNGQRSLAGYCPWSWTRVRYNLITKTTKTTKTKMYYAKKIYF